MSMGSLGNTLFTSMILVSLVEIPSYIFCVFVMDHIGRKPLFVYSLMMTGIFCIGGGFFPVGTGRTVFALIGIKRTAS